MQYRITHEENKEVLCLYLDYNEEFGEELLAKAKEGTRHIAQFLKEKGVNFKGHVVKLFVGSVLVGTMVLGAAGSDDKTVEARTYEQPEQVYTVQSGDSLFIISERTGVSIDTLKNLNDLTSDVIYPGQQLMLEEQAEIGTYHVQAGDSLYLIAERYGMNVNELKMLNNLSTDLIQPGQTLKVVQKAGSNEAQRIQGESYTVQSGDNLSTIAKRFGLTTNELMEMNHLTSDLIHPGQTLVIRGKAIHTTDNKMYTVQPGDNLSTIAKKYNMTTNELKELNQLTSDLIHPGDVLQVSAEATVSESKAGTYIVQPGDNLSTIAKEHGMTTQELKMMNQLTSDRIYPGQVLTIQGKSVIQSYTVQSGDNLWKIARQFNMTIPQLKHMNQLTSEMLQPGQVLRIAPGEAREGVVDFETISIQRTSAQTVTLNLEEYIIGVVSAEMPPYFHEEALKAQALTARTYAAHYVKKGRVLSDTDNHQVYYNENELRAMWGNRFDEYYSKVRNAVLSTEGEVITYGGDLIEAYFFSTSNGRTEEPKYVWGGSVPYLQSVESPWDTRSVEFYDEKTMSFSQFSSRLGLGGTSGLYAEVISYTPGGGVNRINIAGKVFDGEYVRARLGLRSTDFELHFEGGEVRIVQRGWGHRIGMSQYGANYMGQDGYNYRDIIQHYYQGVQIEKL